MLNYKFKKEALKLTLIEIKVNKTSKLDLGFRTELDWSSSKKTSPYSKDKFCTAFIIEKSAY